MRRFRTSRTSCIALAIAASVLQFLLLQDAGAAEARWRFDESIHGDSSAERPNASAGGVELVEVAGANGRAALLDPKPHTRNAAAIFIGGENLSGSEGEVWLRVRLRPGDRWANGRRQWLAAIVPKIGENGFPSNETGVGLAVVKTGEGRLQLAVHRFENGRLNPDYRLEGEMVGIAPPDQIPLTFDLSSIPPGDWTWVGLGWKSAGFEARVSLSVGNRIQTGIISWVETKPRVLIVGAPPRLKNASGEYGFVGFVDELVIRSGGSSNGTPPLQPSGSSPGPWAPKSPRTARGPSPESDGLEYLKHTARRHFDRILESRQRGGWAPIITYPGNFFFLSREDMIPYSPRHYLGMTRASSVIVALQLLAAYQVLDEPRYLEAARELGELLLRLQSASGHWPSLALIESDGKIRTRNPGQITFKDRTQTMPIIFLELLARETRDPRYSEAAMRGRKLVSASQNASGSWPNHVRFEGRVKASVTGIPGAGELNDYATTDGMNLALVSYRESKDLDALASYLKAADWIAEVFIDAGAKGWAKQYDAAGNPIRARHHEPPAVAMQEMEDVPRTLAEAYRITGDSRYREVLLKWVEWMARARSGRGWYANYDPESGLPIRMVDGVISPARPNSQRDFRMTQAIEYVKKSLSGRIRGEYTLTPNRLAELRNKARQVLEDFDEVAGSWLMDDGPQGPAFYPVSAHVFRILALIESSNRLSRGEARGVSVDDLRDPLNRRVPRSVRLERIPDHVLEAARLRARQSTGAGAPAPD